MWINDDNDDELSLYFNYNAETEAEHDTEPPTTGTEDTPIVHIQGTNCRVCSLYNHYMPADNVVDDGKHTCYNCINHYFRWKQNVPKNKIKKLKEYYKLK